MFFSPERTQGETRKKSKQINENNLDLDKIVSYPIENISTNYFLFFPL